MDRGLIVLLVALCCALPLGAQQKDDANCRDHPLFSRMPDYWIHHCIDKQFDAYAFKTDAKRTEQVEGRLWQISYYPQATLKSKPSELQILRNYEEAVKKLGGKVIYAEKGREIFRVDTDGKELWIEVTAEFTGKYGLKIVERKGMSQDIVANASAFANDIKTTGHVALYGIYFDTGKSELKPESEQSLSEIGKLLTKEPNLKVYVVGHTDNAGGLDANMKLSQNRADAVVQALVHTQGIAASRLKAFGAGPYAPVATNDTEDGKAKNRRVELVKQ
jgi:OmpA-OmpF porin, OOP family